MLRKLRIKFIIITMSLLLIVIAAVFTSVCISTSRELSINNIKMLELASKQKAPPPMEIGEKDRHDRTYFGGVFNVEIDSLTGEKTFSGGNITVSDETLGEIVNIAIEKNDKTGKISEYNLSYMMDTTPRGIRLSFRDLTPDINSMNSLIRTLIIVGLCAAAAFFLISVYLAGWAMRPVEKSWAQQRQFVADASHELKSPLAVIRANCDMIMSHEESTVRDQKKWLGYIKAESERLSQLASDLLFLAKSDAKEDIIVFDKVNFSDVAWGSVLPFESVAFEMKKSIESNITPEIFVKGDANMLHQLIVILLDNACKHSSEGSVISVNLTATQEKVKFSVQNTGEPIPEEHQERLFERFYRIDKARSRADGGVGLGLAIAKKISENHGGKISLISNSNEGTVFTVTLPRLI